MARAVVLGGGGFLGSHLVRALLREQSWEIEAIDTSCARLDDCEPGGRLVVTEGSIVDRDRVARAIEQSELCVSMAALCNPAMYNTRPTEVIAANYDHLVPVVELCAEHRCRLIHLSTCEVYGLAPGEGPTRRLSEEDTPLQLGPVHRERWTYACAKQLLERLIWAHGTHGELEFTIVRPFNVIGPRMDFLPGIDGEGLPRVLACFAHALLAGRPLGLVGGGTQRRAFCHVDDFIDGLRRVIHRRAAVRGEILNLGDPRNDVSIADLARRMIAIYERQTGLRRETIQLSADDLYGAGYDDVDQRIPDIARARELLDWQPRLTLDEMLPAIVADYRERYEARCGRQAAG